MMPKVRKMGRIKEKGPFKSQVHRTFVSQFPCAVPFCFGETTLHHCMHIPGGRAMSKKNGDEWLVPLCKDHHQDTAESVHQLGGERQFKEHHGIDLIEYARKLKRLSKCPKTRAR